ncbi:MAG: hypothetical protein KME30_27060 [Iphinoe sp. HA4291-MV1]|jgi:ABC-type Na+ efflux pump permease subunit|nr:hypothetical protein [Iphinoe sp. HA4291-MV1]
MATTKPGQKIHIDTLKATLTKLEQLEEKPKEELSLRESIYFLRDKLHSALKKGYSYQDLSALLEQQGILVSAATLKQYLTEIDKEKRSKKRVAKSEQAKQASTSENIPNSSGTLPETELTSSLNSSVNSKADLVQSSSAQENHELTDEKKQIDDREQEQETSKPAKQKQRRTTKSNTDMSDEFNQY